MIDCPPFSPLGNVRGAAYRTGHQLPHSRRRVDKGSDSAVINIGVQFRHLL